MSLFEHLKLIEEFGKENLSWLRKHRDFDKGITTRHSIARIIKVIDTEILILTLFRWANRLRAASTKSWQTHQDEKGNMV